MDVRLCVYVLCCTVSVEAFATSSSLIQRGPTMCLKRLRTLSPQKGGQGPVWTAKATDNDDNDDGDDYDEARRKETTWKTKT
jgi:hypothetical protein